MEKLYRGKGKQPDLPKFVPMLMFFDLLFVPMMGIAGLIVKEFDYRMICFILMTIGIVVSYICEIGFNWNIGCYYVLNNKNLEYRYFLNGFGVSDKETILQIEELESYKYSIDKKKLVLKGKFKKKMPLREGRYINKATVQIDFEPEMKEKIINKLEEMKKNE